MITILNTVLPDNITSDKQQKTTTPERKEEELDNG